MSEELPLYTPYTRDSLKRDDYYAIFVGSGFGALTAAALLALEGKTVLVLEQCEILGGTCHVYEEDGFAFSGGLHCTPGTLFPLWEQISEGRIELTQLAPQSNLLDVVHIVSGDSATPLETVEIPTLGTREMMLKRFAPDDRPDLRRGINAYWDDVEQIGREKDLLFLMKYLTPPVFRPAAMFFLNTFRRCRIFKLAKVTFLDYIRDLFPGDDTTTKRLRALLFRWAAIVGYLNSAAVTLMMPAVFSTSFKYYPVGGVQKMIDDIIRTIVNHGGEAYSHARVSEIVLDENDVAVGVRIENDGSEEEEVISASFVVSNVGLKNTFDGLLPPRVRPPDLDRFTSGGLMYFVGACLGFDCPFEELGLPDIDMWVMREDMMEKWAELETAEEFGEGSVVDEFPPYVYIPNPNSVLPAKEGCASLSMYIPTRFERYARWKGTRVRQRGSEYEDLKQRDVDRVLEWLFATYPKCRDHLVYQGLSSPLSNEFWTAWPNGEAFGGCTSRPERWLEVYDKCARTPGGVKGGLVMVGQDVMSSPGVLMCVMSGVFAVVKMTRSWKLVKELRAIQNAELARQLERIAGMQREALLGEDEEESEGEVA